MESKLAIRLNTAKNCLLATCAVTAIMTGVASGQTASSQQPTAVKRETAEKPKPADALNAAIRSGRAIFNAHGLTLVLATGQHINFNDKKSGCPSETGQLDDANCQHFFLASDLPRQHFFLVRRQDYEGGPYFLVDDHTGRRTEIDGVPRFSPDGKRFFVQNDNVATEHENNLEIWRRKGNGAAIEWAHSYKQVYVEAPALKNIYHTEVTGWRGNRITLAFSSSSWFDTAKKSVVPAFHWTGSLTRQTTGWHLEADWPKAS